MIVGGRRDRLTENTVQVIDTTGADQLGGEYLVLETDLPFVAYVLPLAATARAEIWAGRLHAKRGGRAYLGNQPPE